MESNFLDKTKTKSCKIFILTNTLKNGGAEKQAVIQTHLLSKFYETYLVVYYGNNIHEKLNKFAQDLSINIIYLEGKHAAKLCRLAKLFNKTRKQKICIVFSFLFTTNIINATIARWSGVHYCIGGIRNSKIQKFKLLVQKFFHNYILDYTIFNNYSGCEALSGSGFNNDKSIVIPNAIQIQRACIKRKHKSHNINILMVGRFVHQKDYVTALKIFEHLHLHFNKNDFKAVIVGHGILEDEIYNTIKTKSLQDVVKIVRNPDDLSNYYEKADIFLSTSLFEGTSNVILEAMEYSLPVVVTNVGDNNQLVLDGKSGFICLPKDVSDLTSKLSKLIVSSELRGNMGMIGYRHVITQYSYNKFQKKYVDLIERLCNEKKT